VERSRKFQPHKYARIKSWPQRWRKRPTTAEKLQDRIVILTFVVAGAAIAQVIATAWPYLVW
jgi:hypothetical protein